MNPDFWLQKWRINDIGFHQTEANPLLVQHFQALSLAQGSRVFLPLCGKTRDIAWLLSHGYRVAGAELSDLAIEALFLELGITPEVTTCGTLKHYSAHSIDIFVGDIFNVSAALLGPVDAVYDRAALVALPESMREHYTSHLARITAHAPQLVICFEYDPQCMAGPPFSIDAVEIHRHYGDRYRLDCIASVDVAGGLKGICAAKENVWLLSNDERHGVASRT